MIFCWSASAMADGEGYSIAEPDDEGDGADNGDDTPAKGGKRGRKPRRQDELIRALAELHFWRNQDGIAFVSVPVWGHKRREHMRVNSREFRQWVTLTYFRATERGLSGQAQSEAVSLAEARALDSGETRHAWRRAALGDDGATIFLDLGGGDPRGERRAVKITAAGWEVIEAEAVPVPFLRAADALPLPEPEADAAKVADLRGFVNVAGDDDLALAWAWIVCALRPFAAGGSYPILCVHGEHGTGKSQATRFLQGVVDPSTLTGRATPREERDIFVSAGNRHVLAYDNLSSIPEGFADAFCRIATGGAFSSRAMFTDADESILSALKPFLLNGIPATLTGRPDMASRALSLELARLTERRAERELIADYERALPGLLGLACDGLASALRNLDRTTLAEDVRMIDAATWAEAAAVGLDIPPGRIAAAWVANRNAADRALVESDELALAVAALLADEENLTGRAEWRGSPSDLFHKLGVHASDQAKRGPQWPRSPSGMGTRLKRLNPAMRAALGIDASAGKGGADGVRFWVVRKV
jgi:putative DNA primase/helicase